MAREITKPSKSRFLTSRLLLVRFNNLHIVQQQKYQQNQSQARRHSRQHLEGADGSAAGHSAGFAVDHEAINFLAVGGGKNPHRKKNVLEPHIVKLMIVPHPPVMVISLVGLDPALHRRFHGRGYG